MIDALYDPVYQKIIFAVVTFVAVAIIVHLWERRSK